MDSPRIIGRYVVLTRIAGGGMADLHRALAAGPDAPPGPLVIKQLSADYAKDGAYVAMFRDEAALATQLVHPGIVRAWDHGSDGSRPFIIMEYVPGGSLGALAERGHALPPPLAVHVVLRLLDALHHAHGARGPDGLPLQLVHRDVSPHNVLVGIDGSVKLADFGIARATTRSGRPTGTGQVKGNPGYLAPEQAEGSWGPMDARVDVFACGAVLFELLAGRRMRSSGRMALVEVVEGRVPDVARELAQLPLGIASVVRRALEPRVLERFQSAEDMARALEEQAVAAGWRATPGDLAAWMRANERHGVEDQRMEDAAQRLRGVEPGDAVAITRALATAGLLPRDRGVAMAWMVFGAVALGAVVAALWAW